MTKPRARFLALAHRGGYIDIEAVNEICPRLPWPPRPGLVSRRAGRLADDPGFPLQNRAAETARRRSTNIDVQAVDAIRGKSRLRGAGKETIAHRPTAVRVLYFTI